MSVQPEPDDKKASADEVPPVSDETAGQVDSGQDIEAPDDADIDPLEAMQVRADENWEKYLRTAAELENVRKRAQRDVENAHKFSLERFARELLAVRDSLELGIESGAESGAEALLKGKQATLDLLSTTMDKFGIEEIDPHGEPFDPALHEAMTMQPATDVEPGSVMTVFQKGYMLNGRLLRPARVVVAQEIPVSDNTD